MIPVAPFSLIFLLIITLGPLALFIVLVWAVLLLVQPQRRANFKKKPWPRILFLLPLLVLAAYYSVFQWESYQFEKKQRQELASRQHVLKEPGRFAGVDMPTGTELELNVWGDPDSVSWARFPEAVMVGNAPVLSFERPRPDLQNSSWKLHLAGDTTLEGWQCDGSQVLEMEQDSTVDTGFRFVSCFLSKGNRITGWSPYAAASNMSSAPDFILDLPAGTLVQSRPDGTLYTNGERDQDRWMLRVEAEGLQVHAWNLPLERAYFSVDKNKDLLYLSQARLAEEIQFGGFTYPAGTRVSTPNYRFYPQWPLLLKMVLPAGEGSDQGKEQFHELPGGQILDGFH
ncbi:hypothetical protein [Alcaligenes faecalis]|uniref:hypothetical protein n=2 Tax=Alcaligenes faecalis TaxID=511 RepID=UPI000A2DC72D|nr:hypothetical protein [Alcaligenes faecalis]MBY6310241.1 hypothetical protein [Alcaligenes faecalis]MBY6318950.1 hypothetical protein [Alcaligenes faecalis]MBY6392786.1 hypothetical protein [Alcaligenes faecalis]OSZ42180.1 hypothetical protein BVZ30_14030 [Alcaligenes faecalis]OSZ46821.1 hypothetical protein BVZ31_19275 [Alcaligenes faecalis]